MKGFACFKILCILFLVTSLVDETCVYGRGHDKDFIIEMLLRDASSNKIGVVPIGSWVFH